MEGRKCREEFLTMRQILMKSVTKWQAVLRGWLVLFVADQTELLEGVSKVCVDMLAGGNTPSRQCNRTAPPTTPSPCRHSSSPWQRRGPGG